MAKFIVREFWTNEFYTCLSMESIEAASAHMIDIVGKLRAMGENLEYTIEPAPEAPTFEDSDWLEDFNNTASRHHY